MNITFHTITAIGVAVLITDTSKTENHFPLENKFVLGFSAFFLGIISHGILDYIPHCYPIKSKIDILLGFIIICVGIFFTNRKYRFITALAFLGCIFPDLIDELPRIINKYFGLHLPVHRNYFPWHWKRYSGSIYVKPNMVSALNHIALILTVCLICYLRKNDFKNLFCKRRLTNH
jgi:hypothetical protein